MALLNLIFGGLSGLIGALGMGGGGVLIIFLSAFMGVSQLKAQGINLLFFLPAAAVAVLMHWRKGLIDFKIAWPYMLGGLVGVLPGVWLSGIIGGDWVRKIFATLLIIFGIIELVRIKKK